MGSDLKFLKEYVAGKSSVLHSRAVKSDFIRIALEQSEPGWGSVAQSSPPNISFKMVSLGLGIFSTGNLVIYRSVVGARLGHGWGKNSNNLKQGGGEVGAWLG